MAFKIVKAKEMGFCFGVRQALDIINKAIKEYGSVTTLGALVHNQQVVEDLKTRGVKMIDSNELPENEVVVIPSHGVGPQIWELCKRKPVRVVNATCPFVRRAQVSSKRLAKAGFLVVIFGDKGHPEVKAVLEWADGQGLATEDDDFVTKLDKLPKKLSVLSQTTQSPENFTKFVNKVIEQGLEDIAEMRIINTICPATRKRQDAALQLARDVDVVIVIGGYNSANTRRLAQLCADTGVETHHIEKGSEINPTWFQEKKSAGITSGASTPDYVINEVIQYLQSLSTGNERNEQT